MEDALLLPAWELHLEVEVLISEDGGAASSVKTLSWRNLLHLCVHIATSSLHTWHRTARSHNQGCLNNTAEP
jgi:hypothetical protein